MRKFVSLLMLLCLFTIPQAQAAVSAGTGVRTDYSSTAVGTTNWVVLVSLLSYPGKQVHIFDSSGQTLELGIAPADAAANAEVRQMIIPPGGATLSLPIPAGYRISIRAISATANAGENTLSVSY